jgi:hypothetical protein
MRRIVIALGIPVLVAALLGQGADAAVDTTKPVLKLPARATFVAGTSISLMVDIAGDPDVLGPTNDIQMKTKWSARDASGICGYRYRANYVSYNDAWGRWGSQTSLTISDTDYTNQAGGGQEDLIGYTVQVRDCAGNRTKKKVLLEPLVLQQDGLTFSDGTMKASYAGEWRVNHCLCWSGGTTARTNQAGASATFSQILHYTYPPRFVALVMEKAPDRGKLAVYIDTKRVAVVDTYAATKQHRTVVWVGRWPAGDGHTLTVVNQATPGRTRIDIDAVLAN